ncbi:IspD/TarI family cytidylyltransferase [Mycolicibacterium sediminis]|uniref:2-C-methyl-D-erythritol 4-phosphate cytidylyltransferase n=1 Tax=Mycolicibacterium sediminis TaxID=1286180 RepID=A0A7I7QX44_9MYCO|nr:2-C-methyl-D-erythritol 4-phosphate cytidylyltransferase [Mycolicibacterium sediminis]
MAVGVVLAAGMGTRVGADGNKAYLPLAGRSMVSWSVEAVASTPEIDRTLLVHRAGERDLAETMLNTELPSLVVELVEGGDTRHGSEFNVLTYLADDVGAGLVDVVLIHDGARPLAGPDLMRAALTTARRFGGAIPGLPAGDVVRDDGHGRATTVDGTLVRVQTPQAFHAGPLLAAYRAADAAGFDGTDTSACIQRFTDVDVHCFPGAAANFKVTFPHDVDVAARLLDSRAG